jgi:glycosyltransferase involved in cell wall biosynthesis
MKICFWGDIARTLDGNAVGGGELQIALLATTLAAAGHDVIIIDLHAKKSIVTSSNIKIVPVKNWNKGIQILRTLTHRLPSLYQAFVEQNADIYYCRIRDFRHIIPFWASRKVKAKFILGLASDLDIASFNKRIKYYYSVNFTVAKNKLWWLFEGIFTEFVYPYLIRKSDYVFCQHSGQVQILKQKKIKAILFPNLFKSNILPSINNPEKNDYIYVGSLDKRKGFKDMFELIERMPEYSFKIVGSPRDRTGNLYFKKLLSFNNVKLLGRLPHQETLREISNSKALISTSPMEGFPNVFIEAWMCNTPVLSIYVNPGNLFDNASLGYFAEGSLEKMIQQMKSHHNFDDASKKARQYAEKTYLINNTRFKEIVDLFQSI